MEAHSYHLRFGLQYFIIIGVILFFSNFIIPIIFPSINYNFEQLNDILIVMVTPIVAMVLFNRYIHKISSEYEGSKIDEIIHKVHSLNVNYPEQIQKGKLVIIELLEELREEKL